jgi:hypothetical protein
MISSEYRLHKDEISWLVFLLLLSLQADSLLACDKSYRQAICTWPHQYAVTDAIYIYIISLGNLALNWWARRNTPIWRCALVDGHGYFNCVVADHKTLLIFIDYSNVCELGSSVSIVSDYVLDDRTVGIRSPAEAKEFSIKPPCPDLLWSPPSLLYNWYWR